MSGPGFTPGPWSVVPYGDGDSLVVHSDDENRVCFMATHGGSRSQWERIQANARLIAAAPELYEALLDARAIIAGALSADYPLWIERADAALAKARGETP